MHATYGVLPKTRSRYAFAMARIEGTSGAALDRQRVELKSTSPNCGSVEPGRTRCADCEVVLAGTRGVGNRAKLGA